MSDVPDPTSESYDLPLTDQQAFDIAAVHLLKQGERSYCADIAAANECMYRLPTEDGRVLKCSVGALLRDREYFKEMEGSAVSLLIGSNQHDGNPTWPAAKARLHHVKPSLLQRLQIAHDGHEVAEWRDQLALIAEDEGLSVAVLVTSEAAVSASAQAEALHAKWCDAVGMVNNLIVKLADTRVELAAARVEAAKIYHDWCNHGKVETTTKDKS